MICKCKLNAAGGLHLSIHSQAGLISLTLNRHKKLDCSIKTYIIAPAKPAGAFDIQKSLRQLGLNRRFEIFVSGLVSNIAWLQHGCASTRECGLLHTDTTVCQKGMILLPYTRMGGMYPLLHAEQTMRIHRPVECGAQSAPKCQDATTLERNIFQGLFHMIHVFPPTQHLRHRLM